MSRKLTRSASQSSTATRRSVTSTWTTKTQFPSYEELFYQPPMPQRVSRAFDASQLGSFACMGMDHLDAEDEGDIRELLDEMREWYIEQAEEEETRLEKPLPSTPYPDESDDENAIRRPFGAARALRKRSDEFAPLPTVPASPVSPTFPTHQHSSYSLTPASSTSTLSPVTPRSAYTPSSSRSGSKEPLNDFGLPSPHRPFADVPRSPTLASFQDSDQDIPAYIPTRKAPSPPEKFTTTRARSASLPSKGRSLRAAKSEASLDGKRLGRRPPPLNSQGFPHADGARKEPHPNVVLMQPGFNKSFSAPSSPATMEFNVMSSVIPIPIPETSTPPYIPAAPLMGPPGAASRWSVSTAGKDADDTKSRKSTTISFASGLPRTTRSRSLRRKRPLTPGTPNMFATTAPSFSTSKQNSSQSAASDPLVSAADSIRSSTSRARSSSSPGPESRARASSRPIPRKPSKLTLNVERLISKLTRRAPDSSRADK